MSKFNMASLEKILGKGKGLASRVGTESGNMIGALKEAGKGAADSVRLGRGNMGSTMSNLGMDASILGRKAGRNPFGTAALGAGGVAAAGGAGMGIKELLASLENEEDEYEIPKRRR